MPIEKDALGYEFRNLKPGSNYKFCVRAEGTCGKANFRCSELLLPELSEAPKILVKSGERSACEIVLAWETSETVSEFDVEVGSSKGIFFTHEACSKNQPLRRLNTFSCSIPMSSLLQPPYSLQTGDSIVYRIRSLTPPSHSQWSPKNVYPVLIDQNPSKITPQLSTF